MPKKQDRQIKGPRKSPIGPERLVENIIEPRPIRTASFADVYPEAAVMWDYSKNCGWGPEDFSYASNIGVWFQCPAGPDHNFQITINTMGESIKSGSQYFGCGFCARF